MTCTLTCITAGQSQNEIFFKSSGLGGGEGGCLFSGICIPSSGRYIASQYYSGTYLAISHLQRAED